MKQFGCEKSSEERVLVLHMKELQARLSAHRVASQKGAQVEKRLGQPGRSLLWWSAGEEGDGVPANPVSPVEFL